MAQQISDLVINLDVDSATFSEQVARIKGQLTGMAEDSEKVQTRMQRASERQAAAFKTVGDAGAAAAADMKSRQSAATEGLTKDWQNVSKSVDETHRRVTELNQRMRENDGQAAALAR
ncbi:phage tail tape measure protein, partial [Enterobacter sp. BT223]|nr:phage tail tape measure protein [Enterobacter sp. BT223]